jgi:protein TonB
MPSADYDWQAYLGRNLRYPEAAREINIEGKVMVRFVVNEDGSISDVEVLRGIGGGCDEEAKRVVAGMPKWKPGKQEGKAVKVYFMLPISFKLE